MRQKLHFLLGEDGELTQTGENGRNVGAGGVDVFVVGERSELLDLLIHEYKYNSVRALAGGLAELLDNSLPPGLGSSHTKIVPIPTATHHIRERGLDHTLLLAKKLARRRGCLVEKLLVREKNSVQVGADRKTRLEQAGKAFGVDPRREIDSGTLYIILDDVWTTGASIRAAIEKMREAGAQNIAVALLAVGKQENNKTPSSAG